MSKSKNYCPECGAPEITPGVAAVLRDCRDLISLAKQAAEIEAFPGPAWRQRAAEMVKTLDKIKDPA